MDWNTSDKRDLERDRGVLTKSDRRYLCGQSDIEPETHSERRSRERIRNRVKNALLDFGLLFEELEDRDLEQIFVPENDARQPALTGSSEALAMILDGLGAYRLMQHTAPRGDPSRESFDHALELVGRKRGYFVQDISLEIDADRIPEDRLFESLEEREDLGPEAIRFLLELDEVDTEEVQETIRSMVVEED